LAWAAPWTGGPQVDAGTLSDGESRVITSPSARHSPLASSDPKARELIRVWGAQGSQHVTIAAETWEDAAAWGIMLVDLARHVARSFESKGKGSAEQVLARLREGFDAEWASPTDEPSGAFVE
jgi:hypothetical protein